MENSASFAGSAFKFRSFNAESAENAERSTVHGPPWRQLRLGRQPSAFRVSALSSSLSAIPIRLNARKYLAGCLSAFAGTEEHEVRLALDAHAAFYAREKPWHASQRLKDLPDGRVELTLRISHLNDAKNAAIRWGDHVEVLSPPELREDVHATLARALAKYAPVER